MVNVYRDRNCFTRSRGNGTGGVGQGATLQFNAMGLYQYSDVLILVEHHDGIITDLLEMTVSK